MALEQIPTRTINGMKTVPMVNAAPQANTTGSITANGQIITATDLTGVGSATALLFGAAHAGITVIFEASNNAGTTWFGINAENVTSRGFTSNGSTGGLGTNTTTAWNISPLLGVDQLRVRSTAFTSGTLSVVIHPSTQFVELPPNSQIVSGTVATTQSTSPWITREGVAVTPTITQVTPATTSTTIKASNANRKALIIVNNGTSDCYIAYGATAATTAYTFLLPAGGTSTIRGEEYSGIVTGIWLATGGNAMQVTETV